jgi:hypothetical protein
MTMIKFLAGGATLAALAIAVPAVGQTAELAANTNVKAAADRCSAAVQARLDERSTAFAQGGRVLGITSATPKRTYVRVRGYASTSAYAYSPATAVGALAYAYQPNLSFRCDVDYLGRIKDLDIDRR